MSARIHACLAGLLITSFSTLLLFMAPEELEFRRFVLPSRSSLLIPVEEKQKLPNYNLTARWAPCDWANVEAGIAANEPAEYNYCEKLVSEGMQFVCMMQQQDPTLWASKWTDWNDLIKWGWDDEPEQTEDFSDLELFDILNSLRIEPHPDDYIKSWASHENDVSINDQKYRNTGASYENIFNLYEGVFASSFNEGPDFKNQERQDAGKQPIKPVVPLKQFSDVFFLSILHFATENDEIPLMKNFQYAFRHNVINPDTIEAMQSITGLEELDDRHLDREFSNRELRPKNRETSLTDRFLCRTVARVYISYQIATGQGSNRHSKRKRSRLVPWVRQQRSPLMKCAQILLFSRLILFPFQTAQSRPWPQDHRSSPYLCLSGR